MFYTAETRYCHFTVTFKTSNDLYYDEHDFQQYNHGTYFRYTIQNGFFRVYFFPRLSEAFIVWFGSRSVSLNKLFNML